MELTADLLAALCRDASAACAGSTIEDLVDVPGGGHLLLLSAPGRHGIAARLLVVAEPARARLHLAPPRPPDRPRPAETAFTRDAKPWLRGCTLASIAARPGERVADVVLHPAAAGPAGDALPRRLVAELFGAAPNLAIVDGSGIVRAAKRRQEGARPLAPGLPYAPPPRRTASPAPAPAPHDADSAASPLSERVSAWFEPIDRAAAIALERLALERPLRRLLDVERRRRDQAAKDRDGAAEAQRARRFGDLLGAHFGTLRRGQNEITVPDLFGAGAVTIALDPRLEPHANVERWYRQARRMERAAQMAAERLPRIEERVARLEETLREIAAAPDREALVRLRAAHGAELSRAVMAPGAPGTRRPGAPTKGSVTAAGKRRGTPAADPGIRSFRLASGLDVLVGRTDRDNDVLTTRIARSLDVWMHVQGESGSHVVIRLPRGRTASLDDLLDAGRLAVHYSKRRGAPNCDVLYTPRKFVRKPRGAKPGAVLVERHKTLRVPADPKRLAALLEREPPRPLP